MNSINKNQIDNSSYCRNAKSYLSLLILIIISIGCSSPKALPLVQNDEVRLTSKKANLSDMNMFYSAQSDKRRIERQEGVIHIPYRDLDQLNVKRGKKSHTFFGALAGAGLGAIIGAMAYPANGSFLDDLERSNYGVSGALIGVGVGTLIGYINKVDRWKKVPISDLKLSLSPNGGGAIGLGISFRLNSK